MGYYQQPKNYTEERAAVTRHLNQLNDFPEWLEGVKLAKKVTALTAGHLPGTPAGSWADQIFRAATSVPANIAEGVGRITPGQIVQFLRISRGSAFECVSHLLTCPVPDTDTADLRKAYGTLIEQIDASIGRLIDA